MRGGTLSRATPFPHPGTATLQDMLQLEIDTQTTTKNGSSTDALLWLKRALQFVQRLLMEVGLDINARGKEKKKAWIPTSLSGISLTPRYTPTQGL